MAAPLRTAISPVQLDACVRDFTAPVRRIGTATRTLRFDHRDVASPWRPPIEAIVLFRSHGGSMTLDFETIESRPERAVRVRPDQVVTALDLPTDTIVVASSAPTANAGSWFPGDPSHVDFADTPLDGGTTDDPTRAEPDWLTALHLADAIERHQTRDDGPGPSNRLLCELFDALVALLDAAADRCAAPLPDAYRAFRAAIEVDLGHRHDVAGLANELGYSARTLTRACQQATGRTAKQVLTDRLVLEAKRRLALSRTPAARISDELGFSEPTNFTKFFARNTGASPTAFRRAVA